MFKKFCSSLTVQVLAGTLLSFLAFGGVMAYIGNREVTEAVAEQYVDGLDVTITDIEAAISAYAAEHPTAIKIASKSGYAEVYLTGP